MTPLRDFSAKMSTFLKARALQDRLHGVAEFEGSIKNGLAVSFALGLPPLKGEKSWLLGNKFRTGHRTNRGSDDGREVRFGTPSGPRDLNITPIAMLGRHWELQNYGDCITGCADDHMSDIRNSAINE